MIVQKEAVALRLPKLDERLKAAADLFPPCSLGADIGTDHGRLPLYLLSEDRCQRMIVADISLPALLKAKELITLHQFDHRAIFVQADGLNALKVPVQAISIMGMGGDTMRDILTSGEDKLHGAELILSPHTEIHIVRMALSDIGYQIIQEMLTRSGGRFYIIIHAVPGKAVYTEKELLLGPCLIKDRPALFGAYLRWRQHVAQKALRAINETESKNDDMLVWQRLNQYILEELQ